MYLLYELHALIYKYYLILEFRLSIRNKQQTYSIKKRSKPRTKFGEFDLWIDCELFYSSYQPFTCYSAMMTDVNKVDKQVDM